MASQFEKVSVNGWLPISLAYIAVGGNEYIGSRWPSNFEILKFSNY